MPSRNTGPDFSTRCTSGKRTGHLPGRAAAGQPIVAAPIQTSSAAARGAMTVPCVAVPSAALRLSSAAAHRYPAVPLPLLRRYCGRASPYYRLPRAAELTLALSGSGSPSRRLCGAGWSLDEDIPRPGTFMVAGFAMSRHVPGSFAAIRGRETFAKEHRVTAG